MTPPGPSETPATCVSCHLQFAGPAINIVCVECAARVPGKIGIRTAAHWALEFYADPANWPYLKPGEALIDRGERARTALVQLREASARSAPGEASYESIAEMLPSMLASGTEKCPLCGAQGVHGHSPAEIVVYRNGVKYGRSLAAARARQPAHERQNELFARDGLMCETHPGREWPHDNCAGPGMPWIIEGKEAIKGLTALRAKADAAEAMREALKRAIIAVGVALHRHEQAIAAARADGAFVPEEFGEREADVFRIAIRDGRAALAAQGVTKP